MKLEDFNLLLSELDANPGREQVMNTALAFLEWIGIKPAKDGKGKLLAPKKEELKKYLTRHPVTNQFQLYKLSAEDEAITVRFAFLKKFRKDQITQLIDKESIVHFQGAPPIIQTLPSAPAYTFHIVATAEQNRLYVILNKGDQKRIVSFRRKLTQTQFQKIVPQWQVLGTKSKPEIAEAMWKSLDIKEVNKEFYKQIKEQFDALVGIAKTQAPKTNEEEAKQFAVRLIGRYIFCWFLKEKGIISETLLASATIRQHKKDFFQKYLYQLFFNTLNEEVPSRNPFKGEGGLEELYDTIPYLNGGLFEKHPEDKLFGVLDLNAWLVAFVHVLEDFDFTVDESSSQYQQVAIDPEMLGRIFENLLASQNPETEKMANQRKAFGAFYTPREIVDYMVNQALKSYLEEALLPKDESTAVVEEPLVEYKGTLFQDMEPRQTLINFDPAKKAIADQRRKRLQEHLDKFFSPDCASHPFDKGDVPLVQQKLSEVKILDPACGSGAFPMGVLLRLMELRQLVGHGHRNNYDLKSEILSRNIYGVDIMPMAVEIARLRAWLSLVLEADYKPQDRKNNFGVSALPNLDFKFVCANTLIDSGYDAFLEKAEHNLTLMRLQGEVQKLERIRDSYFDPKGNKQKKEQLQKEFTDTKNYIKTEFVSLKKNWNLTDFLSKVDDWNPFDDSHPSTFFSPSWMFGFKYFDVLIGNPPYIQIQKLKEEIKKELEEQSFDTYERTGDLYQLFYERSTSLLMKYGVLAFITSNKWMRANYGVATRTYFTRNTSPVAVIDFGMAQNFESATTYTNIFIGRKNGGKKQIPICRINPDFGDTDLEKYVRNNTVLIEPSGDDSWIAFSKEEYNLIQKIENQGASLNQWKVKINRGILTGFNDAFIIDKATKDDIVKKNKKSSELIRPILRGEDVKAYETQHSNLYLIGTFPSLNLNIEDYPAIKNHLNKYRPKIEPKPKNFKGEKWDGRKAGAYEWFETQDSISYYQDFLSPKIIYPNMTKYLPFVYDESGLFTNQKCFILTGEHLKYLTGVFNSTLWKFAFRNRFPELLGDTYELSKVFFEKIPIKKPIGNFDKIISLKVEDIIKTKNQNKESKQLEKDLDVIVYKMYNLTFTEVKIVDAEFWLSEEEYNNYKVD
ncbi:MAG: Eco57I restriction-modification methylase domain-containing protein [Cytophagales bacterium]|nr:Eco57I restriction-modification methylase domain-containing protein [Cytophagales bacterium]MCA6371783.1 Eco57I restriction-modification methylase domain-containing protein [Cytophagales bacterium]MCA6378006.1 Eco57I restriction-modification methylase domain-containing protein [Cytophagales bacterium]MCA6386205.1 Eco57I restriction-modification methylase domain-containing protein [Cytophagales bacterium]